MQQYRAAPTVDAFAARRPDDIDLEALRSDLPDAVHETAAPAAMSLWVREHAP